MVLAEEQAYRCGYEQIELGVYENNKRRGLSIPSWGMRKLVAHRKLAQEWNVC